MLKDRVKVSTLTNGTGVITLGNAESSFQGFDSLESSTTYYAITNANQWEVGIGTYSNGMLYRDTVLDSSSEADRINLLGRSYVFVTYPAEKSVYISPSSSPAFGDLLFKSFDGWDSRSLSSGDITNALGYIPFYDANSGIKKINDTFVMDGTGVLNQLSVISAINTSNPLVVRGAINQSANLLETQTSSASVGFAVSSFGIPYTHFNESILITSGMLASATGKYYKSVIIGNPNSNTAANYTQGTGNVHIGHRTLSYGTAEGNYNVFLGYDCANEYDGGTGLLSNNVFIGSLVNLRWSSNSNRSNNVFIGGGLASNRSVGAWGSGSNNTFIGGQAACAYVDVSRWVGVSGNYNIEFCTRANNNIHRFVNGIDNKLNIEATIAGDLLTKKIFVGNVDSSEAFSPDATLQVIPKLPTDKVMIVRGVVSQSSNLFEVQNSSLSNLFSVDPNGNVSGTRFYSSGSITIDSGIPTSTANSLYASGSTPIWENKYLLNNKLVEISGSYSADGSENVFLVNSGELSLFNPTDHPKLYGMQYYVKALNDNILLIPSGGIDGSESSITLNKFDAIKITPTANGWYILSKYSGVP